MKCDSENALTPDSDLDRLILRELLRKSGPAIESVQIKSDATPDDAGCFAVSMSPRDHWIDLLDYTPTPVTLRLTVEGSRIKVSGRPEDGRGLFAGRWVDADILAREIEGNYRRSSDALEDQKVV